MILSDLIDLENDFGQKMPNYRGVPNRRESIVLLNRALKIVGRALRMYDPMVTFKVMQARPRYDTRSAVYFGRRLWRVDEVVLGGSPLLGPTLEKPKVWSLNELRQWYPSWRADGPGTPQRAVAWNSYELMLHPTPDSAAELNTPNYVAGMILPGVWGSDGGYSPLGFQTGTASDTGGTATATVTSAFATGAVLRTSIPNGTAAGAGNTAALDGAVLTIGDNNPLGDDPSAIALTAPTLAVPDGAVINWVRVENAVISSPEAGEGVTLMLCEDAASLTPTILGQWDAAAVDGPTLAEAGPGPEWTGISLAQIRAANFGVQVQSFQDIGGGGTLGAHAAQLDYLRISVNYTAEASAGGGTASVVDLGSYPDFPEEGHEILAYAAAYLAAEPFASEQRVMQQIALYDKRWSEWCRQLATENSRALSPVDDAPYAPWGYRYGR